MKKIEKINFVKSMEAGRVRSIIRFECTFVRHETLPTLWFPRYLITYLIDLLETLVECWKIMVFHQKNSLIYFQSQFIYNVYNKEKKIFKEEQRYSLTFLG